MRISVERLVIAAAIAAVAIASLYTLIGIVSSALGSLIERRVIECGVYGYCPVNTHLENGTCQAELVFGNETVSIEIPCVEYSHVFGKGTVCGYVVEDGTTLKLYVFEVCNGSRVGSIVFERVVCGGWVKIIACGKEMYSRYVSNCTVATVIVEVRCVG